MGTKIEKEFMTSTYFVEATDENYEKELIVNQPVVVKFGASWCQPCKGLQPTLDDLATEYGDKIKFINVDIDNASTIPQKYSIRGVPTILFIKDGAVVNTLVGSQTKSRIQLALDTLLA